MPKPPVCTARTSCACLGAAARSTSSCATPSRRASTASGSPTRKRRAYMNELSTRLSPQRFLLVVAAFSVLSLAASGPIRSAGVATGASDGMADAPQSTTPVPETATAGNVRAELDYVKDVDDSGFTSYRDLRLTISRDGRVVASAPPSSGAIDGLWPANGWQEGVKSVHVADLDGDHEPEVDVDLYTGGLHCCHMLWAYRWNGTMYVSHEMQTGSFPYTERDLNHDGRPE